MEDSHTNGMLTAGEVSRILHVHVNTVRRWTDQGKLRASRVGPRRDRRFWREDVDACLQREMPG